MEQALEPGERLAVGEHHLRDRSTVDLAGPVANALAEALGERPPHGVVFAQQAMDDVVGRERVIAGTDCGFGTSAWGRKVDAKIAWAKLQAMVEGARIASEALW